MCSFQDMTRAVTCRYNDKIKKACEPLLQAFDLAFFGYAKLTNEGHYSYLGTHVGWSEYFAAEKLYLRYPYYRHPQFLEEGISVMRWVEDRSLAEILDAWEERFQIHHSLGLIYKNQEGMELFCFGTNTSKESHLGMLLNEMPLLKLFAKKFREENPFLSSQLEENQIDLMDLMGPTFYEKTAQVTPQQVNREEFLKKLGIKNPLSSRESEVARLLRKGSSATLIGEKIFLSPRTIEHHLERMKEKLGCDSKVELIQKVSELEQMGYL